jgi:hypothetical protein
MANLMATEKSGFWSRSLGSELFSLELWLCYLQCNQVVDAKKRITLKRHTFIYLAVLLIGIAQCLSEEALRETTKDCFACFGKGQTSCKIAGCKKGEVDCPAPCLKLSKGNWIHKDVPGHSANELWQEFRGKSLRKAWSQGHIGQVIQMQNGEPVNIGTCKTCNGTTRVKCGTCKGTGESICSICDGKKIVPASWTEFDNPKMKDRPKEIRFKDGRVIRGKILSVLGDTTVIKKADGERIEVKNAEVVK